MALKDTQNSIEVISQNLIANTCPENLIYLEAVYNLLY